MKNIIAITIGLSVGLLASHLVFGQGTVYLSNLNQNFAGSFAVGSDSWQAPAFITGTNSGGYLLDSVQLGMADASGSPIGFTVMICPDVVTTGDHPGSSLSTLIGSANPSTVGSYNYTPTSALALLPDTIYFIVISAGTSVANGAYEWNYADTQSYNPIDNWGGGGAFGSNNGLSWHLPGPPYYYPQYAITATAIPESSPAFLLLLGSGVLFYVHQRRST